MDAGSGWPQVPCQPSLTAGEVHLWWVWLDGQAARTARLAETLSFDERQRAQAFRFDVDRARFVARRGVLRALLGRYLRLESDQISFTYGEWGKPALAEPAEPIRFNLTHSGGLALYAFAWERDIGVDLEAVKPLRDMARLVEQFFSPQEREAWQSLSAAGRVEGFYRCWTRKEAFLKALGVGLSRPTEGFSVSLCPNEPARLLQVTWAPAEVDRWMLAGFEPYPGYFAAVAVEGQGPTVWTHYQVTPVVVLPGAAEDAEAGEK